MSSSVADVPASGIVRLALLGDLMLSGEWEAVVRDGRTAEVFRELREAVDADLVFANLETTSAGSEGVIDKEPRVVASTTTLREVLADLGVGLVNLSNNHAFDAYNSGFREVRELLGQQGILHFGAGDSAAEASRPQVVEFSGLRLGWLGYVAPATDPSHIAGPEACGVNVLESDRVLAELERLRPQVEHCIVSLHWGVEYCNIPSPEQIAFARQLIDSGAKLVVGHHAHAVQGVEEYRDGLIAYNLGNVTTTDFFIGARRAIRQTPRTRSSFVLRVELSAERIEGYELVPFRSQAEGIRVGDRRARGYLGKANRALAAGVSPAVWKRRQLIDNAVRRPLAKLHPSVIGSVRPHHFATFFRRLGSIFGREPRRVSDEIRSTDH